MILLGAHMISVYEFYMIVYGWSSWVHSTSCHLIPSLWYILYWYITNNSIWLTLILCYFVWFYPFCFIIYGCAPFAALYQSLCWLQFWVCPPRLRCSRLCPPVLCRSPLSLPRLDLIQIYSIRHIWSVSIASPLNGIPLILLVCMHVGMYPAAWICCCICHVVVCLWCVFQSTVSSFYWWALDPVGLVHVYYTCVGFTIQVYMPVRCFYRGGGRSFLHYEDPHLHPIIAPWCHHSSALPVVTMTTQSQSSAALFLPLIGRKAMRGVIQIACCCRRAAAAVYVKTTVRHSSSSNPPECHRLCRPPTLVAAPVWAPDSPPPPNVTLFSFVHSWPTLYFLHLLLLWNCDLQSRPSATWL